MSDPQRAKTIAELRSLSDEELVRQHDMLTATTTAGTRYYLARIRQ
jgi:hypothetical protein